MLACLLIPLTPIKFKGSLQRIMYVASKQVSIQANCRPDVLWFSFEGLKLLMQLWDWHFLLCVYSSTLEIPGQLYIGLFSNVLTK